MKIETLEEIIAWQKARKLNLIIYKTFSNCKDYSFKNQIKGALVSVMNNIAEGFERHTNKEFKNFLFISKGSCGKVGLMISLALGLNYINKKEFENIYEKHNEISKILSGFIKTL